MFNSQALKKIPVLDPETWQRDRVLVRNHTLVRFRGMVQDMPDPEFFVGTHRRRNAQPAANHADSLVYTMYRDTLDEADEGNFEPHETMERRPLMLTPIPGEAPWAKLSGPSPITMFDSPGAAASSASSLSVTQQQQQRPKRTLEAPCSSAEGNDHMMDDDTIAGDRKVPRTEVGVSNIS